MSGRGSRGFKYRLRPRLFALDHGQCMDCVILSPNYYRTFIVERAPDAVLRWLAVAWPRGLLVERVALSRDLGSSARWIGRKWSRSSIRGERRFGSVLGSLGSGPHQSQCSAAEGHVVQRLSALPGLARR